MIDTTEEEMARRAADLRDRLSRGAIGEARATALWRRLMSINDGDGPIAEFHRAFCRRG